MTVCATCGVAIHGAHDPTTAEARVLHFIVAFHDQYGRFPTYREIRVELAYRSLQAVRYHVHKLEKKGWLTIQRAPNGRGILAALGVA